MVWYGMVWYGALPEPSDYKSGTQNPRSHRFLLSTVDTVIVCCLCSAMISWTQTGITNLRRQRLERPDHPFDPQVSSNIPVAKYPLLHLSITLSLNLNEVFSLLDLINSAFEGIGGGPQEGTVQNQIFETCLYET